VDGDVEPGPYTYRVSALNSDGDEGEATEALQVEVSPPTDADGGMLAGVPALRLAPNPFNPQAVVRFRVERSGPVQLVLYDARGRLVHTLVDGILPAGRHQMSLLDGTLRGELPSGVYFLRLRAGARDTRLKAVLLQ
ncbi:MAG: T9SS type A sorting domain-containing protein, partial [Candidatus Krumholzibacteriia bacterium]